MNRERLYILLNKIVGVVVDNLYVKPREIVKLCINSAKLYGVNYFPEKEEKGKFTIFFDQLINIIKYGAIDEYYYLYGLNIKGFRDKRDYLNYRYFSLRRDELNLSSRFNTSCILRNKLYFGIFAKSIGIATPENVAYSNNDDVLLLESTLHTSINGFVETHNGTFFCKPIDGECGKGVFKLSIKDGQIEINNVHQTVNKLTEMLNGAPFVIQKCITQHTSLAKLHSSSTNSMRMVSVKSLKDGHIEVLPSILRIGANGSIVDNTSQGGIAVGFDPKSGRLNKYGYFKPTFGMRATEHPNSGIKFEDFTIPFIKEVVEQAKYFHSFLDLHSIGWDIAIGEDGPIFIEGNDNWEINGPQSCNRGLAKEFHNLFFK